MSDLEYARTLQEKFELYFLALVFTILGLAIQTSKLGAGTVPDLLEFGSWLGFLASGLVGLSRLEWLSPTLKAHHAEMQIRKELADLRQAVVRGTAEVHYDDGMVPIGEALESREMGLAKAELQVRKLERATLGKWRWHKWLMVLGLLLLMAARGQGPLTLILDQLHAILYWRT